MTKTRYAFWTVALIIFIDFLGYGILIPIIPLYAEHFGANEFLIGLLIALYALMQFVSAPLLGRASDAYGRRPVLLLSITGHSLAYVVFGLAGDLWMLFAARLISGVMAGNVAVAQAYVADLFPPERRAKGFGMLGAAFGLGLVFGPALGGFFSGERTVAIARTLLPVIDAQITQFSLPAFVTATLAAANLVIAYAVLPDTEASGSRQSAGLASIGRLLEDRLVSGLVLSYSLRSLAYSSMVSMFVVYTADVYGYGTTMNGYILAYIGVVVSLNQGFVVDKLVRAYDEFAIARIGTVLEAAALSLIPFSPILGSHLFDGSLLAHTPLVSPGLIALLAVISFLSTGDAFTVVTINTLISKSSAETVQGENMGFAQSGDGLARAIGPVIAGSLYTAVGYWAPFVAGGLTMVVVFAAILYLSRRHEDLLDRHDAGVAQ